MKRLLTVTLFVLVFAMNLFPSIIDVPSDEPTIQAGIGAAVTGDTVMVAPGSYSETISFTSKDITLMSSGGTDVTTLRPASSSAAIVRFTGGESNLAVLTGFTITGTVGGPGVYILGASPTITSNVFTDNASNDQEDGVVVVLGNSSPRITRNLFRDNPNAGWSLWCQTDSIVFVNNTIDNGNRGMGFDSPRSVVRNNIAINCSFYGYGVNTPTVYAGYNHVWNNSPDYFGTSAEPTDITGDPLFVDPSNGDYNLQPGSPSIDSGDPDPQYDDLDGSRNDMGAFPMLYDLPTPVSLNLGEQDPQQVSTPTPVFYWTFFDTSGTQTSFEIEVGTDADWSAAEMWASGEVATSDTSVVYSGTDLESRTDYYYRVRVSSQTGWGSWIEAMFVTNFAPLVIRIPADQPTIQAGIDAAIPGDTVMVSTGTYFENITFGPKDIVVTTTNGANLTTLSPLSFALPIVTFADDVSNLAVLSGFTLTGTNNAAGIYVSGASPTITGNIFTENISSRQEQGVVVVTGNSNPRISYNLFYNNPLAGWSLWCPADSIEFINNTIYNGNRGMGFHSRHSVVKNNIVTNCSFYGYGVNAAPATADHNCIWNNELDYYNTNAHPTDISADPKFTYPANGDFTLQPVSPCIDKGDPDAGFNDPDGSRNDMGAFPLGTGAGTVIPTDEWINLYCGNPLLDGVPMAPGVVLHTFDPQGKLCGADTVKEDGSFGFLKVYRDDPDTDWDEGAEPGDPITVTVGGTRVTTDPGIVWEGNGMVFEVCSFSTEDICVEISLHTGWNLVSWNVAYKAEIQETLQDIIEQIDIVLSFDEGGLTYDPDLPQFSDLDSLGFHRGYWFRMDDDATLTICGNIIPREEHIVIHRGWNLVSYWPETALPTTGALSSIITNVAFAYGFDNGIEVWTPGGDPFNTLNQLGPSLGYWIKSYNPDILAYPGFSGASTSRGYAALATSHETGPSVSRKWLSLFGKEITLDGRELLTGSVIEAVTVDGEVCGLGVYDEGVLRFVPVYGYDPLDPETEGLPDEGETLALRINGRDVFEEITWTSHGARVQLAALSSVGAASNDLPQRYELAQNYPNPFNPSTEISFDLAGASTVKLEVYNVMGQKVATLIDDYYEAGHHTAVWDASGVASGLYLYRLQADDFVETRKMLLLK